MGAAEERYYKSVREDVNAIKKHMKSMDESLKKISDALIAMAPKELIVSDDDETELPNVLQHIVGVPDLEERIRREQPDFHITCDENDIPEDKGL